MLVDKNTFSHRVVNCKRDMVDTCSMDERYLQSGICFTGNLPPSFTGDLDILYVFVLMYLVVLIKRI